MTNERFEDTEPAELEIHIKRNDTLYKMREFKHKNGDQETESREISEQESEPTSETDLL